MVASTTEQNILAHALYEIRVLLAPYLGANNGGPIEVRVAAHLAYALHNEALAVTEGWHFDVEAALAKVKAIDSLLKVQNASRLLQLIESGHP